MQTIEVRFPNSGYRVASVPETNTVYQLYHSSVTDSSDQHEVAIGASITTDVIVLEQILGSVGDGSRAERLKYSV